MTKKGFSNPNRAPKADRVQGFKCDECEHLHVALLTDDGRFLATAIIDKGMLMNMLVMIDGPPTIGETTH